MTAPLSRAALLLFLLPRAGNFQRREQGAGKRTPGIRLDQHAPCHRLHLLAPEEREPRLEGDLRLLDAETGSDVVVSFSPRMLRIYRESHPRAKLR